MRAVLVASLCLALIGCASSGSGGGGDSGSDEACEGSDTRCTGNTFQSCQGGNWTNESQCAVLCDADLGCVQCSPGGAFCMEDDAYRCAADGQSYELAEDCTGDLHCSGGTCRDLCADAAGSKSYLGCEYYAVDLDNAVDIVGAPFIGTCLLAPAGTVIRNVRVCTGSNGALAGLCQNGGECPTNFTCQARDTCVLDAQGSPFAVVVANPQVFPVDVTISIRSGQSQTTAVMPGEVKALFPGQLGFPDQSLDDSGVSQKSAYKVVANAPIAAYQFNPLDNVNVFSNDGSLLLPRATWDDEYLAISWPSLDRSASSTHDFNGYLAIVAGQDDTVVEVTPTAGVRKGPGWQAMAAGETRSVTLGAGQVLNLEAVAGGDLTGTRIRSTDVNKTIGVFTGHEATVLFAPGANCCADHLEEMVFPSSTWGSHYVVARSQKRASEADLLRIVALHDDTTVTLSAGTCPTLASGQFCDVDAMNDVEIQASGKILVGHLIRSTTVNGSANSKGDPSMALSVPTAQFRSDYSFLVPQQYDEQYISVAARAGEPVFLDGTDVSAMLQPVGTSGWAGGRIPVQPGQHKLECAAGCGLEVYGYSSAVSYLFAGGLDLKVNVE
jgi:hypothetical protein